MGSELGIRRLGDVAKVRSGFAFKSSDMGDRGCPVIKIKNIKPPDVDVADVQRVPLSVITGNPRIEKFRLMKGDVLIAMTGATVGKVGRMPEVTEDHYLNQRVGKVFVHDSENAHLDYIYYVLSQDGYVDQMFGLADGSAQANISGTQIEHIEIPLPPLPEQKAIAHILGTLDDKIELNRKMNETLEAMAQAIFKSWFVDFEPTRAKVEAREKWLQQNTGGGECSCEAAMERAAMAAIAGKTEAELDKLPDETRENLAKTAALFPDTLQDSELGEIPVGWEVSPFSDICEINPRRNLKKKSIATYLDMKSVPTEGPSPTGTNKREFKSGSRFINGDTLLARITPCLENGKTAFVDFLADGETGWGSTEFIVLRPKKDIPKSIGYFFARSDELRSHAIQSMVGTSGRQRVAKDAFDHLLIPKPKNTYLYKEYGKTSGAVLDKIRSNSMQSFTLAQLRDTLLPKLLSGEVASTSSERRNN
ncbi:MAG: restriction endonuclease subunit S [Verrucomicrobia bacterium]|nr:restriction endonuclease subunit S [Verrucomicrobiota bacterium]MCH8511872.1 restriction endonuclease subunit S [Kiritimatiellia bacterium]